MAARYPEDVERLEDIYQDEIIKKFASILDFKKFARSKNGLCLDETDIQHIVEDHPDSVEEQKMLMLRKWEEKTGPGATAHKIRSVVENFRNPDNDYVHLSGEYGYYKSKRISKFSQVYFGEQRSKVTSPREVVIKLIEYKEKNKREAENLLKLGQHPNVAGMFYSGLHETSFGTYIYIVMEACRRENLGEYMKRMQELGISLSESVKMAVAKQFFRGMEFIHFNHIVHRDVKPDNVLISMNGKFIKIGDYGLSKTLRHGCSTTNLTSSRIGTDGYRAPEVYFDKEISQSSDVFSSALVAYAIVSDGKHPYGNDPDKWNGNIKENKNCKLQHIHVSEIKPMKKLFQRMLQSDPKKRPTIEEVLEDSLFKQVATKLQLVDYSATISVSEGSKKSSTANAVILFDRMADRLLCFTPSKKLCSNMQKICEELEYWFTLIALKENLYALREEKMYRLKYSDPKAKWDQVKGTNENHGEMPPAVALNGSIYVCGTGDEPLTSSSVEMYNTDSDIWTIIPGITIARMYPCVVAAKDCIYCIGGKDEKGNKLRSVQRLEVETRTVTEVDPILRPIHWSATAVEKNEILYVTDDVGIECYDIQKNSWETMKTDQWPPAKSIWRTNIHFVDDQLYVVFSFGLPRVEIYKLNQTTGKMTLLEKREDLIMLLSNSVAVKL